MEGNLVCFNQLVYYKKLGIYHENVILLHGWGASSDVFNQIAPEIEKMKIGVITPDLPGFGKSELPKKTFNTNDYVQVIVELTKKLKLPLPLIVAGHSFGGKIALKIAHEHPEIVRKLILIDSAGVSQRNLLKLGALKLISKTGNQILKLPLLEKIAPFAKKIFYKKISAQDYAESNELRETFLKIIEEDLTSILPNIKQETAIFWGEEDQDTPLIDAEKFNKLITNSKLFIIKNAGHYPFIDQPQIFLKEFLNAVS